MKTRVVLLLTTAAMILSGCVSEPLGPTVYVGPGKGKSPVVFEQDEQACEDYAGQRTAGQAEAANNRAVGSALIGTALGAGLGAAVGGGHGAGIGAASGAVVGTAVGTSQNAHAQYSLQDRYNIAYAQCMQSRGNSVPQAASPPPSYYPPPPPPPGYYPPPPPPPGYYPPPPPPGY